MGKASLYFIEKYGKILFYNNASSEYNISVSNFFFEEVTIFGFYVHKKLRSSCRTKLKQKLGNCELR